MSQLKLSDVFPPSVKPTRSGVYKTWMYDLFGVDSVVQGYSYYSVDLNYWFNTQSAPLCAKLEYQNCRVGNQNKHWQGILK